MFEKQMPKSAARMKILWPESSFDYFQKKSCPEEITRINPYS